MYTQLLHIHLIAALMSKSVLKIYFRFGSSFPRQKNLLTWTCVIRLLWKWNTVLYWLLICHHLCILFWPLEW